jgi:RNA polymerase sigma-70 factor (ECF subfamily)
LSTGQVRSRDEITAAIRGFTAAQWGRLKKVAGRYAQKAAMPAEDLLQEAFARALEDDGRKCPIDVDVVRFLAEAMRSIADGEREKAELIPAMVSISVQDDGTDPAYRVADGTPTVEQRLVREEETAQRRHDLFALFDDDPQARDIVEGTIAGMTADDMRELTGLDKKAYDSKRKLIRRRIDKKYPDGWTP